MAAQKPPQKARSSLGAPYLRSIRSDPDRMIGVPRHAQFLIATHSPILLAYPGGTLYQFEDDGIRAIAYRETEHYRVTKEFLNAPERIFQHLFSDEEASDD